MLRKVLITVSVMVALILALGVGVVAYAQGGPKDNQAGSFLSNLAKRLNITPEALQQAVRDAAKDSVAQAVTTGRLTQDQATKANERIDQWQGQLPLGGFGPWHVGRGEVRRHMGKVGLEAAAKALGMELKDLMAELSKGQSLRQIAQAKNVDPAKVQQAIVDAEKAEIDKAVAAGKLSVERANAAKTRIEQMVATLMDRQHSGVKPPSKGAPFQRPQGLLDGLKDSYAAAATALGMTPQDLAAEVRGGKTLRQIAQAKNVDPAKVQQAIVDAANAQIDKAVADGKLTSERAAQAKTRVAEMAARLMDAGRGQGDKTPAAPKPARRAA